MTLGGHSVDIGGDGPTLNNTLNHLLDFSLVRTVEMSHYVSLSTV